MSHQRLFVLVSSLFLNIPSSAVAQQCEVRGVKVADCSKYTDGEGFACPSTKEVIPKDMINDNYCDCPGSGYESDEPGTAACASSRFFCENIGSTAMYVRSSIVNDGRCDCCDGSDEWAGRVECPNLCIKDARVKYRDLLNELKVIKGALSQHENFKEEAKGIIRHKKQELNQLKRYLPDLQSQQRTQEDLKNAADVMRNHAEAQWLKLRDQKELDEREEKKKAAEAAAEMGSDEALNAIVDTDLEQDMDELGETAECTAGENTENCVPKLPPGPYQESCRGCILEEYRLRCQCKRGEEYLRSMIDIRACKDSMVKNNDGKLLCIWNSDKGIQQPKERRQITKEEVMYKKQLKGYLEAHRAYDATSKKIKDTAARMQWIESFLESEFGENNIMGSFVNCMETGIEKYTYEVCPFDRVMQSDGEATVVLGRFKKLKLKKNGVFQMVFHEGDQCWNGPKRKAKVELDCGSENKFLRVEEMGICEYEITMETPAACKSSRLTEIEKKLDELDSKLPSLKTEREEFIKLTL